MERTRQNLHQYHRSVAGVKSNERSPQNASIPEQGLESAVNRSEKVQQLSHIQASVQRQVAQLGGKHDKKFDNDPKEYTPNKEAEIHVHEYATSNWPLLGHLKVDGLK